MIAMLDPIAMAAGTQTEPSPRRYETAAQRAPARCAVRKRRCPPARSFERAPIATRYRARLAELRAGRGACPPHPRDLDGLGQFDANAIIGAAGNMFASYQMGKVKRAEAQAGAQAAASQAAEARAAAEALREEARLERERADELRRARFRAVMAYGGGGLVLLVGLGVAWRVFLRPAPARAA